MNDTNKVAELINTRADIHASKVECDLINSILLATDSVDKHGLYAKVLEKINARNTGNLTFGEIKLVFNTMKEVVYERAYRKKEDEEILNVSNMLSFMQNEIGDNNE